MTKIRSFFFLAAFAGFLGLQSDGLSQSFRALNGYVEQTFANNDDDSLGPIAPGFSLNFFGQNVSNLYINNNGNVSFGAAVSAFTPFSIPGSSTPMIAPFFADVDTTNSTAVTYGAGTLGGFNAFVVNWLDVKTFGIANSPLNSFQLVLIDRSDTGVGNFDFEFNYTGILWEAGERSGGGLNGLGGTTARAGYTNGAGASYELAGSGIAGAFLDSAAVGLIDGQLGAAFDGPATGRYSFSSRSSTLPPIGVPDHSATLLLSAIALATMTSFRRWGRY